MGKGRKNPTVHRKEKSSHPPSQPQFINWAWYLWYGIDQLGLAVCLCSLPAPADLLTSWTWETGKIPWFLSNNWKHQCYQHSFHAKSKTQQLLGGKLTLSQPKPGQFTTIKPQKTRITVLICIITWRVAYLLCKVLNIEIKLFTCENIFSIRNGIVRCTHT